VPALLISSAFPLLARAARDDQARLGYALQRLFEVSLIAGALFALATSVGAPVAVDIIGGSGYHPAAAALRIQGGAMLFSFLLATWGFALISLHRHRALLAANALAFAVSAAVTLALAPSHGAKGAAIATLAGEGVLAAAYLVALVRARPDLRPDLRVVPKVVVAAGAAIAVAVVSGLPALPATLVAGVVYAAAILALRAVPDELIELIPRRRG
jgi:O-antigen/teichoic acid export membrane protein